MNPEGVRTYLQFAASKSQSLGKYDCVRFAVELVNAGFGKDYRDEMKYSDRRSAVQRLRKAGGLRAAFTEVFGEPVSDLKPGAFVFYSNPDTIGVLLPNCVAVFAMNKLNALDVETAQLGWNI